MQKEQDPVVRIITDIVRTFKPNIDDEKRFAKYQQSLRKKSDTPLLEECMLILDIIDTKTAALLQYIAISLAIFLFLFGMIGDDQSFNITGGTKSVLSVAILGAILLSIFAIILCLSCLNIIGAHTVFDLSKEEYETHVISVTLRRRNRYRLAQRLSITTSLILLFIFVLIGFEYATIFSDPNHNVTSGFSSLILFFSTATLALLPLLVMFGTKFIRPIEKRDYPGWNAGNIAAFGAALSWGIGNYITRFSSKKLDYTIDTSALIEIGFLNYLGGFIALFSYYIFKSRPKISEFRYYSIPAQHFRSDFAQAIIFKSLNTIFFIFSVSLIISAESALLENTHVIWVGLYVVVFGIVYNKVLIFISALLVFFSIYIVLGVDNLDSFFSAGYIFGLLSGVTYSIFIVRWDKIGKLDNFDPVTATMIMAGWVSFLLMLSLLFINNYTVNGPVFSKLSNWDYALQLMNGIFNVGLTYYLISYASKSMESYGSLSTVVISLALGFSVFTTLLSEVLAEGVPLLPNQTAGILVFSIGFVLLRYSLNRAKPSG